MQALQMRLSVAFVASLIAVVAPAAAQTRPVPCRSAEALYRGKLLEQAAETFRALEASATPPDCLHTAKTWRPGVPPLRNQ